MRLIYVAAIAVLLLLPVLLGGRTKVISMYRKLIPASAVVTALLIALSAVAGGGVIGRPAGTGTVGRLLDGLATDMGSITDTAARISLLVLVFLVLLSAADWYLDNRKRRR